jgi:hypothetical protein
MNEINRSDYYTPAAGYQNTQAADASKEAGKQTVAAESLKEVKGTGTYGNPKLSQKALDYYNSLKEKYGDLNFVLVASDKKQEAEAIKGSFASSGKLTVLIDTDKIERMAEDETYRNKIESTIRSAASDVSKLAGQLGNTSSGVTAYGMTIDKNGNASYFAVIDKSLIAQKERIEKKAEEKREANKAELKDSARKKVEERLEEKKNISDSGASDRVTVTANSIDELLKKLRDYEMELRADQARTEAEKSVGQSVDYRV